MSEAALIADILISLGARTDCCVWRMNTGVYRDPRSERRIRVGLNGAADISGIGPGGRRLEIEAKTARGRQSDRQRRFQAMIEKHGGVYRIARSVADAHAAVDACYQGGGPKE